MTIPLTEEIPQEPPNPIFLLNTIRKSLLQSKGLIQVLPRGYRLSIIINKLQCKISQDPQKAREVLWVISGVHFGVPLIGLDLDILRKVDDQGEAFECVFIDTANAVVDELGAEEEG